MKKILSQIAGVLWPRVCVVCGEPLVQGENHMCLKCRMELPMCHTDSSGSVPQALARFTTTQRLERVACLYEYVRNSPYAALVHAAKYHGQPRILVGLASMLSDRLATDGFFSDIDFVVPVPMHPLKQMLRGYNQTHYVAKTISRRHAIPMLKALRARRTHLSQTHLGADDRWKSAHRCYTVIRRVSRYIAGRHLLVVDDVLTSGATLCACCDALRRAAPNCRISVLTIAITSLN